MSIQIADDRNGDAHTPVLSSVSGRRAALAARNLRKKLMNPSNAMVDHGIEMKNGWPVPRRAAPVVVEPPSPPNVEQPPHPSPAPDTPIERAMRAMVPTLQDFLPPRPEGVVFVPKHRERFRIREIINVVAARMGLMPYDILCHSRIKARVRARQIAVWVARQVTKQSLPKLGRCFGGRDHTTILHAILKIDHLRERDEELVRLTDSLVNLFIPYRGEEVVEVRDSRENGDASCEAWPEFTMW